MAKLPTRRKAVVWLWRRGDPAGTPDELFVHPHVSKGRETWAPLSAELEQGETYEAAARLIALAATGAEPLRVTDLQLKHEFTVKSGPSAGAWSERILAAELPPGTRAGGGRWLPHYEAKAQSESPRHRDAVTEIRARLGLKP